MQIETFWPKNWPREVQKQFEYNVANTTVFAGTDGVEYKFLAVSQFPSTWSRNTERISMAAICHNLKIHYCRAFKGNFRMAQLASFPFHQTLTAAFRAQNHASVYIKNQHFCRRNFPRLSCHSVTEKRQSVRTWGGVSWEHISQIPSTSESVLRACSNCDAWMTGSSACCTFVSSNLLSRSHCSKWLRLYLPAVTRRHSTWLLLLVLCVTICTWWHFSHH